MHPRWKGVFFSRWVRFIASLPLVAGTALAQQQGRMGDVGRMGQRDMMDGMIGGGMWVATVLTILLTLAAIFALVALAIFLLRRSRHIDRTA